LRGHGSENNLQGIPVFLQREMQNLSGEEIMANEINMILILVLVAITAAYFGLVVFATDDSKVIGDLNSGYLDCQRDSNSLSRTVATLTTQDASNRAKISNLLDNNQAISALNASLNTQIATNQTMIVALNLQNATKDANLSAMAQSIGIINSQKASLDLNFTACKADLNSARYDLNSKTTDYNVCDFNRTKLMADLNASNIDRNSMALKLAQIDGNISARYVEDLNTLKNLITDINAIIHK
jgi:chromosome segregation ATPase